MAEVRVIESVLRAGQEVADRNRARLDAAGVLGVNLMSAPGSGKTTLLQQTIPALAPARCAVFVGDLQTSRDAERIAGSAAAAVQINTGRGCHLNPMQVQLGLDETPLDDLAYLFIENVGNMVCPAAHTLGEHCNVALLSVPEGDDKVAKYPTLFQRADAILVNKIDLVEHLDFDRERVRADLDQINTRAPCFDLSTRTGEGLEAWLDWLRQRHAALPAG